MPITDQVATAPCTDPVQARCLTFEVRPVRHKKAAGVLFQRPFKGHGPPQQTISFEGGDRVRFFQTRASAYREVYSRQCTTTSLVEKSSFPTRTTIIELFPLWRNPDGI